MDRSTESVCFLPCVGVLSSVLFFKACCEVEVLRLEVVSQHGLGILKRN